MKTPLTDMAAVVVTYNRLEKLKKAMQAFDDLSIKPAHLIIVNNASTDGTKEYLDEWQMRKSQVTRHVLTAKRNLGGSGGFRLGLEHVLKLPVKWVWLSDDDAYPDRNAFAYAGAFAEVFESDSSINVAAFCGAVYEKGDIAIWHRRRIAATTFRVSRPAVDKSEYAKSCFGIDAFSYVGAVINVKALQIAGLPESDYFIHYDDTEHSLRLGKVGHICCMPSIIVLHDADSIEESYYTWKDYYSARNWLDCCHRHFSRSVYNIQKTRTLFEGALRSTLAKDADVYRLYRNAQKDERIGKLGISTKYPPGFTLSAKKPGKILHIIKGVLSDRQCRDRNE